ncbi:hypothetical protein Cgig2_025270 [Carnegiea gigantea]|uniref:Uncharacterized protein n=1 Tax=Carnegiea gigantea TaxID=171969 RepID=A0A9Q1QFW3_9CARY|nr:hypothetical protein Cgig2_025270 [Carnegiea gigantea]
MVVPKEEKDKLVYDMKFSSVVPGRVTGDNKSHELKPIDLAMKLHYIKGLYFFRNNKTNNNNNDNNDNDSLISLVEFKKPMFEWLVSYFMTCGRIRLSSDPEARPILKLNDAGIRLVEARSSKTVHEWLAMEGLPSLQDQLVYGHALGPELGFSPLAFIQVTWFKCGGISVGLYWAHVLGDVFSASAFMNVLGQHLQGKKAQVLAYPDHLRPEYPLASPSQEPLSLKRVDSVGDYWAPATNCKMGTHFFKLSSTQLAQLVSKVHGPNEDEQGMAKCFEVISAIMWKTLAKIRKDLEPRVVTVCRPKSLDRDHAIPHNGQVISTLMVNFSASNVDVLELMSMITESKVDESNIIEEVVEKDNGKFNYIIYGANLTLVDMEDANIYGFKVEGQCPIFANYTIGGVGEGGSILVLPGAKDEKTRDNNSGKVIVVTLPEYELEPLKNELKKEWYLA